MTRLLRLAARLYPPAWRDRYGVEFQALMDETKPRWRDIVDVLNGGLQMRLRHTHPAFMVAALSMVGAFGAGAIAFNTVDRFTSKALMLVQPAVPWTASETTWVEDTISRLARDAFSREFLTGVVRKHDLYHSEHVQSSTEALVNRLRADIRIQLVSPRVVQVSFTATDADKPQKVADELMSQLVWANLQAARESESQVRVLDRSDEPRASVSPRRVAVAGIGGLGGGALIGTLIGLRRRRHSQRAS